MASSPEIIRIRTSARMMRLAAARRAQAVADNDVCELCSEPIDYDALARTTRSWSLEHRTPMKVDITLAYEPSNHGSAHYGCNAREGRLLGVGRSGASSTGEPQSQEW